MTKLFCCPGNNSQRPHLPKYLLHYRRLTESHNFAFLKSKQRKKTWSWSEGDFSSKTFVWRVVLGGVQPQLALRSRRSELQRREKAVRVRRYSVAEIAIIIIHAWSWLKTDLQEVFLFGTTVLELTSEWAQLAKSSTWPSLVQTS